MEPSLILLGLVLVLLVANLALGAALLRRRQQVDLSPLLGRFEVVERTQERVERALREDLATGREEAGAAGRQLREELGSNLLAIGDSTRRLLLEMTATQKTHADALVVQLTQHAENNHANAGRLREEVGLSVKGLNDSLLRSVGEHTKSQKEQIEGFSVQLGRLTESNEQRLEVLRTSVEERLRQIQEESTKKLDRVREEAAATAKQTREETVAALKQFSDSLNAGMKQLTDSNEAKLEGLKGAVETKLQHIREDNTKQLEQMRQTVDEKLQGALEQRLGESFRLVSDRLEQVHKGLGEMQTLATGVGDLKRVLTNVKVRGTWGEVQLAALLEQVLTPEQFAVNVATNENSGERVEFAIKLPGRGDDPSEVVWLPIDSKFPHEDYQQLVEAQERGDLESVTAAAKRLEVRIRGCAKEISEKYLNPPATTDFGILFLPTEGLYAEVIRRPGLIEAVQRECRVVIAGPTTLAALLNSLQMGFRTLAIQKRSSEVWKILGAVKTEFGKFGGVIERVQKKLREASNVVEDAATRTRVMNRKLKNVEELPAAETSLLLGGPRQQPLPLLDAIEDAVLEVEAES